MTLLAKRHHILTQGSAMPGSCPSNESAILCRVALKAVYERLLANSVKFLLYLPADRHLCDYGEAIVDGWHPTDHGKADLGFLRMSDALGEVSGPVLREESGSREPAPALEPRETPAGGGVLAANRLHGAEGAPGGGATGRSGT